MKKFFIFFVMGFAFLVKSYGQAGSLDPSFGGKGWVATDFVLGNFYNETGRQILVQSDGKLILVFDIGSHTIITRYNTDGIRDNSYGANGYSEAVQIRNAKAALQHDGKVVIAGYKKTVYDPELGFQVVADIALARFKTDGTLDSTFSDDGLQTTDVFSFANNTSIALQSDGRIIVTRSVVTSELDFGLFRYNADGTLDVTFDGDGRVTTSIGSTDYISSVAIQSDDKIVAAGYSYNVNNFNYDFAIARYNSNGSPDNTFDGDGKLTTAIGSSNDYAYTVAIQSDGKIVAAGNSDVNGNNTDFALARYNSNGSLDNSFSGDGRLVTPVSALADYIYSIAIANDDKIVVAGSSNISGNHDLALARYNPDGSLDPDFSLDGKQITSFGTSNDYAYSVVITNSGRILTAGTNGSDFALVQYNADGNLDNTFSGDGMELGYYPTGNSIFTSIADQPDGLIVATGLTKVGNYYEVAVARYNPDGNLDPGFSGDGKLTINFPLILFYQNVISSVAVQSDGKITIVGIGPGLQFDPDLGFFAQPAGQIAFEVNLNPDGTFDDSFSTDGIEIFIVPSIVPSVVIENDGKILFAGGTTSSVDNNFTLVRYNNNGSLDANFGVGGLTVTDFGGSESISSLAIQSDGKIVAVGTSNNDFAIARYDAEGNLDISFDGDGKLTTDFGSLDSARSVAFLANGTILVAGSSGSDFAIARYDSQGNLDDSFDGDGKLTTDLGSIDIARIVEVHNSKIIAAGRTGANGNYDFALVRYNGDGSLDATFDGDGKVITDLNSSNDEAYDAAIYDNNLYLAGSSQYLSTRAVVAAYQLNGIEISCPTNQSVFTTAGTCNAVVNGIDPILTPTGATSTVNYTLTGATSRSGTGTASGQSFNKGITTVTYTLADDATKTCLFTVTVNDNEIPVLTCPPDTVLCFNNSGNYTIPLLKATDNCAISTTTYTITGATTRGGTGNNASGALNPGINTISWTVTDESGNSNRCQVAVTVNQALVVTIPDTVAFFTGVEPNTVYIGFNQASSIVLKAQVSGGDSSSTYLWSTGATSPSITVSPTTATNYTVTVTDGQGCTQTASRQVNVRDVRCGNKMDKVQVCRVLPRESRTLCVSPVQAYVSLLLGASLGSCEATAVAGAKEQAIETTGNLNVRVTPNPSNYFFTLVISGSNSNRPVSVRIMDAATRLVEARSNIAAKATIQLGHQYRPGIYYAEVIQGGEKVIVKMVKQP